METVQAQKRASTSVLDEDLIVSFIENNESGPGGKIAVLSLNRPKTRNAFSQNLVRRLEETIEMIGRDTSSIRVVIVRSAVTKIFCAGADLKERIKMLESEVGPFVTKVRSLMSKIENLPQPVIAAIDGAAVGGGLELALACDLRVASSSAKMGLVETRLANIPGSGGTQRLPRIIGVAKAKEMILTARMVEGEEAEKIGLVNQLVQDNEAGDAAYQKALELAQEICDNGPIAVRLAKLAINRGLQFNLDSGLTIEASCFDKVIPTADRVEGLRAFREKRKPKYSGC